MPKVLGLDHGERRVGLAVGDTTIGVATGLPTITHAGRRDLRRQLAGRVEEYDPERFVVGYPLRMDGSRGERCEAVEAFIRLLTGWFGRPVVLWDERLTSAEAGRIRMAAGTSQKEARQAGHTDRAAAILLLQNWFDSADRSGLARPGPEGTSAGPSAPGAGDP